MSSSNINFPQLPKGSRIAILCQYFYPENVTAASLPYEMAQELVLKGFRVKAITGMPKEYYKGPVKKEEIVEGIHIHRIKYMYRDRRNVIGRFINNFSFFVSVFNNHRKLKDSDVVITYSSPPINPIVPAFYSKKYGFKLIYVVYDIYPDMAYRFGYLKPKSLGGKIFESANKYVYKRCNKIIVLSEEMKKYYKDNIGYADKLAVIPNWYIDDGYLPYTTKNDGLSVLYGGNVGIVQDVDTMFGGIASLKDYGKVKFYFAAHGSRLDVFIGELQEQGIDSVVKLGYLKKAKYDIFLDSADIAIISLDPRMAGLASPSKYYSYIAKGKPVIFIGSRRMDVAKEIIKYDIGYVVDNGNFDGFKSIIIDLINDKSCLVGMSQRARKLFLEKYTLERSIKQYIDVINEVQGEKI